MTKTVGKVVFSVHCKCAYLYGLSGVHRPSIFSNDLSSEAMMPILLIFHT